MRALVATALVVVGCGRSGLPTPSDLGVDAATAANDLADLPAAGDLATSIDLSMPPDLAHRPSLAFDSDIACGGQPMSIGVGDLTRDGIPDIVCNTQYEVFYHFAEFPPLTFSPPFPISAMTNARGMTVADMDSDGIADLLLVDAGLFGPSGPKGSVLILRGGGNGAFSEWARVAPSGMDNPFNVVAADFDGDHTVDFAVHDVNKISVMFGGGAGTFTQVDLAVPGQQPSSIVATDLDNDGKLDVLAFGFPDAIQFWRNLGGHSFAAPTSLGGDVGGTNYQHELTVADLNGDGHLDIVAVDPQHHGVQVLLRQADGSYAKTVFTTACGATAGVASADFDRDGNVDIAVACATGGGTRLTTQILTGRGDGTLAPLPPMDGAGGNQQSLAVADFNADGLPDLIVMDNYSNLARIYLDHP